MTVLLDTRGQMIRLAACTLPCSNVDQYLLSSLKLAHFRTSASSVCASLHYSQKVFCLDLDLCKGIVFSTLHASMAYANMMRSGLTASKSLTTPFCAGTGVQQLRRRPLTSRAYSRRQFAAMAQATYDIWVKGSPEKNELGDCECQVSCLLCCTHIHCR